MAETGSAGLHPLSRKVKEVIRAAGLRDELSFTSFRHGGFTETGDAGLTDREIMAQGRHKSVKVLPKYVKRTTIRSRPARRSGARSRTKDDQSCRMSSSTLFRMAD